MTLRHVLNGSLFVLLLLAPAWAAAQTELTFVPSTGEVQCNQEIDVAIHVDASAVDLRGLTLKIDFDETLLDLVDVDAGQLFDDAPCDPFLYWTASSTGTVQVDVAGLGCSVDGPGAVVRVRFLGVADGVSPLAGLSATLRTSTNAPIASTWVDGYLLVSCPIDADESTWSALKVRLR